MTFHSVELFDQCVFKVFGVDTVYTENGLHRPVPSAILGSVSPSYSFSDVNVPSREKFSRMVLPLDFDPSAALPTFIRIREYRSPNDVSVYYGWVDSIRPYVQKTSQVGVDGGGNATYNPDGNTDTCEILWHLDWWLTAGGQATFGAGRMLRGPVAYARPDPALPRKWVYAASYVLNDNFVGGVPAPTDDKWVLLIYQKTDSDEYMTEVRYLSWQLNSTITSGGNTYQTVTKAELYGGLTEDRLSLDPNSIVGLYILPFKPMGYGGSLHINVGGTVAAYDLGQTTNTTIINYSGSPSDVDRWIVTDQNGQTVGEVGWGLDFDSVVADVDIGTEGCYVRLKFMKSGAEILGEGRIITVPAIAVPVTSNAMATYTYSGQREYDRQTARINQQQNLTNSIANIGTTAIGGAIAGSMVAPGPGTVAGAVAGVVAGTVGAGVSYYSSGHYDKKAQEATDKLMSSQTGNLILTGNGFNWLYKEWYLVQLIRDPVSYAEYVAEHNELGFLTDTQVANCTSLISARGPLRIEGLEVAGIPGDGAAYISNMFARGVHLD